MVAQECRIHPGCLVGLACQVFVVLKPFPPLFHARATSYLALLCSSVLSLHMCDRELVKARQQEIVDAWNKHFGG